MNSYDIISNLNQAKTKFVYLHLRNILVKWTFQKDSLLLVNLLKLIGPQIGPYRLSVH